MRTIDSYIKLIEKDLFPALYNKIGLKMNTAPITKMNTIVTYNGDLENKTVTLEFSSNHKELADYFNTKSLFVTLYYNAKGTQAGVIDLDYIDSCVEIIYSALYELGYRSQEDIEEDRKKEEERLRKEKQEELKKKQDEEKRKELISYNTNYDEIENEPEDDLSSEESIEEFEKDFDMYLDYFNKKGESNSSLEVSIGYSKKQSTVSFVSVDCFYISSNKCLVQTHSISPEIDKAVSWDSAKDYIIKVAQKLDGVISTAAYDPEGNSIELEKSDDSNNVNLGIDI